MEPERGEVPQKSTVKKGFVPYIKRWALGKWQKRDQNKMKKALDDHEGLVPHKSKKLEPFSHKFSQKDLVDKNLIGLIINADCLTNKLNELKFIFNLYNPDFVGVSEVLPKYFKGKIYPEEFKMAGYDMIPHPNIEKNKGRGSILYIRSSLIHKEIKLPKNCDDFEELADCSVAS